MTVHFEKKWKELIFVVQKKKNNLLKKFQKFNPSKASPIRVLFISKKQFSLKTIPPMFLANDLVLAEKKEIELRLPLKN